MRRRMAEFPIGTCGPWQELYFFGYILTCYPGQSAFGQPRKSVQLGYTLRTVEAGERVNRCCSRKGWPCHVFTRSEPLQSSCQVFQELNAEIKRVYFDYRPDLYDAFDHNCNDLSPSYFRHESLRTCHIRLTLKLTN